MAGSAQGGIRAVYGEKMQKLEKFALWVYAAYVAGVIILAVAGRL
jgi:hypothetical protein